MSWQGEGQEGERERQKGGEWERGVVGRKEKRQERESRRGEGAGRRGEERGRGRKDRVKKRSGRE